MGAGQDPASVREAVRRYACMSTTAVPDGDPPCSPGGSGTLPSLPSAGGTRRLCTRETCGGFETGRGPEPEHREGPRGLSARDAVKKIRGELPNDTRRAKAGDIFEIPPQRGRAYPAFLEKRGLLM